MAMVRTVFLAEMLRDFEHQRLPVFGLQRVQDRRQIAVELHVDDGADDLGDAAGLLLRHLVLFLLELQRAPFAGCRQSASAPEMISISSLVIIAWRVRL
jgi:hypothetical protein